MKWLYVAYVASVCFLAIAAYFVVRHGRPEGIAGTVLTLSAFIAVIVMCIGTLAIPLHMLQKAYDENPPTDEGKRRRRIARAVTRIIIR